MEVISASPAFESFVSLSTHQTQTPQSFFSGPPVLYLHSPNSTIKTQSSELASAPALKSLFGDEQAPNNDSPAVNGHSLDAEEDLEVETAGVDIWVASERFILFSPSKATGLSIPYPSISLHAIQRSTTPSLFLQLLTQSSTFDDHDPDATVSLTITPPVAAPTEHIQPESAEASSDPQDPVRLLYTALSDCANLHPDPASPGSDDESGAGLPNLTFEGDGNTEAAYTSLNGTATALPPPMPGSGGWITADNVNEFFDEEGNFTGGGEVLGQGAGSVRSREEADTLIDGRDGDEGQESDETKWRRTG